MDGWGILKWLLMHGDFYDNAFEAMWRLLCLLQKCFKSSQPTQLHVCGLWWWLQHGFIFAAAMGSAAERAVRFSCAIKGRDQHRQCSSSHGRKCLDVCRQLQQRFGRSWLMSQKGAEAACTSCHVLFLTVCVLQQCFACVFCSKMLQV
jgi:hypothetical protein